MKYIDWGAISIIFIVLFIAGCVASVDYNENKLKIEKLKYCTEMKIQNCLNQ